MYATKSRVGDALSGIKHPADAAKAQRCFETAQENTLEDLKTRKKEIIDHLQEEPTFLNYRPQVYCADSYEGGFDGLRTVLGQNQRKKEAMPKLVSDMFVATRSTTSLDMMVHNPECPILESKEPVSAPPVIEHNPMQQTYRAARSNSGPCKQSASHRPMEIPTPGIVSSSGNTLYNSLGSSFEIASSLSNITRSSSCPETEFSSFPYDDDDEEILIPWEHTVVSKFGPISRMARAKTNNCAPVQVTANSNKKITPALAANPLERPTPIAMPVNSRFGTFGEQYPEPSVKPTPTEAPSVWQESPQPSQMNIALLRAGAAEAVSNNERLAYELQAVELEISLKTGRSPEPVRKIIHEFVSNPTTTMTTLPGRNQSCMSSLSSTATSYGYAGSASTMMTMMTNTTTTSMTQQSRGNMGHGHVTEFLTKKSPICNPMSSDLAARDIMQEYQRSWKGLKSSTY